ncbi:maltose acetyltransferase domain-containing protein [Alteromonas sp. ASW11-130]|uniref:maltose acetyltransferase domain-containing protein n=1 Tax=Alteromonas sp. ASW11-130 TaxID=3015775 RepID=UPI002241C7A7|nr:maltose acetyltransferase domain-containing protein [Alteromonas sp. ASW11-130]MCW8091459.1 hypothetical protein [Alteromonas sp. ASW11-130]
MHPIWQSIYAGKWYSTHAKPLRKLRIQAKQACWQLNQLDTDDHRREELLRQLCPHMHSVAVGQDFYCDYGFNIHCKGSALFGDRTVVLDAGLVKLGNNFKAGNAVVICALHHPKDSEKRAQGLQRAQSVIIGNNVTLADNVTILPGAVIPDNTMISEREVVSPRTFV